MSPAPGPEAAGALLGGALAVGGFVTAAGALVAAGAVETAAEGGPGLSLSVGEVAIVASLLGAVCGALGLMFRTLQADKSERIKDQGAQLALAQGQAQSLQAIVAAQTDKIIALLQGEIANSREATVKMAQAIEEMTDVGREGRESARRGREAEAAQHREILVALHALAQGQGLRLGSSNDPHVRQMREEARRLTSEGAGPD